MVDFAGADILKSFPALQLAAGVLVIIVGVFLTLRAARDNKKDAHIAPQGHDPMGLVVMTNSALAQISIIVENGRRIAAKLEDVHEEQVKTNARLSEMTSRQSRDIDSLREALQERPRRSR
jgi:predicted tellurium resistance membrane protein TerC